MNLRRLYSPSPDLPISLPMSTVLLLLSAGFQISLSQQNLELQRAAMARQRSAIALQRAVIEQQRRARRTTARAADCEEMPAFHADRVIRQAAGSAGIDPELVRQVMRRESGFRPCAVSMKGAMGLMQLMPKTAATLGVRNAFDPEENAAAGARYLKQLLDLYKGDLKLALAAYNAGPARVTAEGGIPPFPETLQYVDLVLRGLGGNQPIPNGLPVE